MRRWVVCDYCDIDLELDEDEMSQGWYTCPECGQLSHLAEAEDENANPVFRFPSSDDNVKSVQVAKTTGAEQAALEVCYLRANGIESFAWQKGGGIGAFYIMVRKDQEQEALSIRGNLVECDHC